MLKQVMFFVLFCSVTYGLFKLASVFPVPFLIGVGSIAFIILLIWFIQIEKQK